MSAIKVQFRRPPAAASGGGGGGGDGGAAGRTGGSLADLLLPESRAAVFGAVGSESGVKGGGADAREVHVKAKSDGGPVALGDPALSITPSPGPSGPSPITPTGSAKRKAGLLPAHTPSHPAAAASPSPSAAPASHAGPPRSAGQPTTQPGPAFMRIDPRALHEGVRIWGYKGQGNDRGALEWPTAGPAAQANAVATSSAVVSPPLTPKTKHKRKAALASQASTARLIQLDREAADQGAGGTGALHGLGIAVAVAAGHAPAGAGERGTSEDGLVPHAQTRPAKKAKKGGSRSREVSPVAPDPSASMKRTRSNGSANLVIPASLAHAFPSVHAPGQPDKARRSLPPPSPLRASAVPVFQQVLERGKREREKEEEKEKEMEEGRRDDGGEAAEASTRGAQEQRTGTEIAAEDGHPPKRSKSSSTSPRHSPRSASGAEPSVTPTPGSKPSVTKSSIPPIILRRTVSQDPAATLSALGGAKEQPGEHERERPTRSTSLGRASLDSGVGLGHGPLVADGASGADMSRSASANGRTRRETTMPRNLRDYDTKLTA